MKKRNKYERIQLVKEFELNTENNILIEPNAIDGPYNVNKFFNDNELKNCSIRTFRNKEVVTPHHAFVSVYDAYNIIPKLHKDNYSVILATPINPKDCALAGAAWVKPDEITKHFIIEIAYGPGTVRRVTHDNKIDKQYITSKPNTDDSRINFAINQFKKTGLENVIFEFSWYKKPIGHKKQNFICWEITDDGTGLSKI